jgi:hypothetical protein
VFCGLFSAEIGHLGHLQIAKKSKVSDVSSSFSNADGYLGHLGHLSLPPKRVGIVTSEKRKKISGRIINIFTFRGVASLSNVSKVSGPLPQNAPAKNGMYPFFFNSHGSLSLRNDR